MQDQRLEASRFTFAPFPHPLHPNETGDSGRLQLATMKAAPSVQYIVKNGSQELGCNEYMYHKVAAAVGLYTQEVRLFKNEKYRYAAAIDFVPNARLYRHAAASAENRNAFYGFKALFVILNESDSCECYLDENDRLFKLDNAASFKLDLSPSAQMAVLLGGELFLGIRETESSRYEPMRTKLVRDFGQEANEPYLETFRRFATLDMDIFLNDIEVIEENYSLDIARYFYGFIAQRIKACGEYVEKAAIQ